MGLPGFILQSFIIGSPQLQGRAFNSMRLTKTRTENVWEGKIILPQIAIQNNKTAAILLQKHRVEKLIIRKN